MRTPTPALLALILLLIAMSGCSGYQSVGKSSGAYIRPVSGPAFKPVDDNQWYRANHALVYFYRPDSSWARAELSAPSFYVDDKRFFNLRGNGHTWLEVYPGERQFDIRRPLLGIEGFSGTFDHILEATVELKPGKTYYLRYSELEVPSGVKPLTQDGQQVLVSRYAMFVDEETALREMRQTRFLESRLLVGNSSARSIVHHNRMADYQRRHDKLMEEREAEIRRLQANGHYKAAPWYKPFSEGTPTRPLRTDAELKELERERDDYLRRSRQEEQANGWLFNN